MLFGNKIKLAVIILADVKIQPKQNNNKVKVERNSVKQSAKVNTEIPQYETTSKGKTVIKQLSYSQKAKATTKTSYQGLLKQL